MRDWGNGVGRRLLSFAKTLSNYFPSSPSSLPPHHLNPLEFSSSHTAPGELRQFSERRENEGEEEGNLCDPAQEEKFHFLCLTAYVLRSESGYDVAALFL